MPDPDSLVAILRETLVLVLMISAPMLGAGVLIGLVVSLVQSVTSIQDQTLTFVPKIVVMTLVAAYLMSWIFQQLTDYASMLLEVSSRM